MNKFIKKGLVFLSTIGLTAGSLASFTATISAQEYGMEHAMENYQAGDTFVATGDEPLTIEILYRDHPNYPIDLEWDFFKILEEKHNVVFEIVSAPLSDYNERRSVLISAGEAPGVISNTWGGEDGQFWASGAILPISQFTEYLPNYTKRIEEWDFAAELDNNRQLDGNYYRLSGLSEFVRHDYTLAINKTIFDEYGIEEPNTWDELKEALATLKEETGNIPFSDQWQGNSLLNYSAGTFNTVGGWGFGGGVIFDDATSEFVYAPLQEGYKDMVTYFAGLVADGLMNPESFTQEDKTAMDSFNNLESYVISGNAQTVIQQQTAMDEIHGEGAYEIKKITIPEGPNGATIRGDRFDNGFMFTTALSEQDDFIATLQFFDWLLYSDEGVEYGYWGIEGQHFEKTDEVAGGYKPLDPIDYLGLNPSGTEHLQNDYGFRNGVFAFAGPEEIYKSVMDEAEIEFQEKMNEKFEMLEAFPPYPMEQFDAEQLALIGTTLEDTTNAYTLRFITGQYELDRWDEFVAELENQNAQGYVDIINTAYRNFQETLSE